MSHARLFSSVTSAILALSLLAACAGDPSAPEGAPPKVTPVDTTRPPVTPPPQTGPAPVLEPAASYLEEVLDLMSKHSLHRHEIDWKVVHQKMFEAAAGASTIVQSLPGIQEALHILNDPHTSFRPVYGGTYRSATRECQSLLAPDPRSLPPDIGYVRVGAFASGGAAATAFANAIQDSIRARDRADLAGWIVDLRGNGGGNMWPMLAGLAPLIGEGVVGYFIDPDSVVSTWELRRRAAMLDGAVLASVDSSYTLLRSAPRVAVLIDNGVASSGEATLIAFRGRPKTRTFGVTTCGLSTSNVSPRLSDGSILVLTEAYMADRNRRLYGDGILPDEKVETADGQVARAVAWLRARE